MSLFYKQNAAARFFVAAKPGGKLFETCANGNLLMRAPAAWPYQVNEKPRKRLFEFDLWPLNSQKAFAEFVDDCRGVSV